MPTTSANQLTITIHKPRYTGNFLSVSKKEWIVASTMLTYSDFKVFLYLAGNADGFSLAYSPQAISNELDISRGTASAARRTLELFGYIENDKHGHPQFYTLPRQITLTETSSPEERKAKNKQDLAQRVLSEKGITEIYR